MHLNYLLPEVLHRFFGRVTLYFLLNASVISVEARMNEGSNRSRNGYPSYTHVFLIWKEKLCDLGPKMHHYFVKILGAILYLSKQ